MSLVAQSVAGLSGWRAVVAPAVGLDHEAEVRPEEVDLEAVDHLFGLWERETCSQRDRTKEKFEFVIREPEGMTVEEGSQGGDARLAGAVVEGGTQRLGVDEVALVRLVHCPLEPADGEFGCEVDQRLDWLGEGDVQADADVGLAEGGAAADPDAGAPEVAVAPNADVDVAGVLPTYPPERGRTAMAQHRIGTAGEDCRHPASFLGLDRPPHRVDTTSHGMQSPGCDAVLNRSRGESETEKIAPRQNPVLLARQPPSRRAPPIPVRTGRLHIDHTMVWSMLGTPDSLPLLPGLPAGLGATRRRSPRGRRRRGGRRRGRCAPR